MNESSATMELPKVSLGQKVIEMTLVWLAVLNLLSFITELVPELIPVKYANEFLISQFIFSIIAGFITGIRWHRKERLQKIDSNKKYARNRGFLRYWLAFMIATYGFAKILKTQFDASFYVNDTPVSGLSGFDLTWNYFGYSYPLAFIVALVQIGGSVMLLFRRTTLMGALLLLPVMINIVLINVFYKISIGAFFNSVIFSLTLLYLVMLRWPDIRPVLFSTHDYPKVRPQWLKNTARILAIVVPFVFIFLFSDYWNADKRLLSGKWRIDKLIKNNQDINLDGWIQDSTVWRTMYLEKYGYAALCPNPYVYDSRSTWMVYEYEPVEKSLQMISYNQQTKQYDTIPVQILNSTAAVMQLNFKYNSDSIQMHVRKENRKK